MLAIDGFAFLRQIAEHPEAFAGVESAASKAACDLIVKRLKAKATGLDEVRAIRNALGQDMFELFVDAMSDANVKALIAKLDKHNPQLKGSSALWQRQHLGSLLDGVVEATAKGSKSRKPAPAAKAAKPAPTPIGFRTEAMNVFRESLKRKT